MEVDEFFHLQTGTCVCLWDVEEDVLQACVIGAEDLAVALEALVDEVGSLVEASEEGHEDVA